MRVRPVAVVCKFLGEVGGSAVEAGSVGATAVVSVFLKGGRNLSDLWKGRREGGEGCVFLGTAE